MLKQRIITAALLIPFVMWAIFFASTDVWAIVMGGFVTIAAWEWAAMCLLPAVHRYSYAFFIALCLAGSYFLIQSAPMATPYLLGLACLWWLLALFFVVAYQKQQDYIPNSPLVRMIIGIVLLVPAWIGLFWLKAAQGGHAVFFLLLLIWIADTGAYFAGKRFGRHKLAVHVSPGKTWEGVAGALGMSILFIIAYTYFKLPELTHILPFLLLCIVTVFISILGDLLESLFKRKTGIKDSSQILPGHGGVLDRIDSLTSAAPLFVVGLIYLGVSL